MRDIEWNFLYFVLQLGTPVVLYLQASALVTSNAGEVPNWRDHFYSVRKRFFGLNIAFATATVLTLGLTLGRAPISVAIVASIIVALSIVGFRSESHRVQLGIACFAFLLNLISVATLGVAPVTFAAV